MAIQQISYEAAASSVQDMVLTPHSALKGLQDPRYEKFIKKYIEASPEQVAMYMVDGLQLPVEVKRVVQSVRLSLWMAYELIKARDIPSKVEYIYKPCEKFSNTRINSGRRLEQPALKLYEAKRGYKVV